MKEIIISVVFVFSTVLEGNAQENAPKNTLALGFQIGQYHRDFSLGLNLTSPYFFRQSAAVRVRGNVAFLEHINDQATMDWTPYSNLSIGLVGVAARINESIRIYGEGGFIFLFPSVKFSSADLETGGYGLLGFEFRPNRIANFFIELGGVGTGANADKVSANPIYSNGLLVLSGVRFSF